jgi:hypothetical protein
MTGPAPDAAWERFAIVVDEAIVLQDSTEVLLAEIRDRRPLADLAERGGPVISRFEALRRELPASRGPDLARRVDLLDRILAHHAMVLSASLDLLSVDWRSERMVEELGKITGLGRPAQWLEALKAELDLRPRA